MYDPVRNFAKVRVKYGYDLNATSIELETGGGNKLPDPATEGAFNLVWWNVTDYSDPSDDPYKEIIRVTAKSGDVLTIQRGQEGTTPQNHNIPGKVYMVMQVLSAKTYEDLQKILVYKDGNLVGFRNKLNFINFDYISDNPSQERIDLDLGEFIKYNFGDGSDGDLVLTTGTTTINLNNQKVFVKKYRNLKITGNATLNFINPHDDGTLIVFLVAGDCELTSNASEGIDLRNLGGKGGENGGKGRGFFENMGGQSYYCAVRLIPLNQGTGGASAVNRPPNSDFSFEIYSTPDANLYAYSAGGGRGGGGLLIMVGGNLITSSNFKINASGSNGLSASGSVSRNGTTATGYALRFSPEPPYQFAFPYLVPKHFLPYPGGGGASTFRWEGSGPIYGGGGAGGSVLIVYKRTKTGTDPNIIVSGGLDGAGSTNYKGADGIGLVVPINAILGL